MKNAFKFFALMGFFYLSHAAAAKADVNIFACEPEWAALAKEIGGENVTVTAATKGTEDTHHIRAKPSLLAAMRRADMLVCTGAGLEAGWLPVLMTQAAGSSVQPGQPGYFLAADFVNLREKPASIDRAMGDLHPEGNPHIQTDPRNILIVAKALSERLAKIDPANSAAYESRFSNFNKIWQSAMQGWLNKGASLKGTPVVVYHDEWVYLLNWLGMKEVTTLEVKPGIPPTPAHLQNVLSAAKSAQVKLILLAPFDNSDAAEWLAAQTSAKIVPLPFTVGGTPEADTLEKVFDQTLSSLVHAE